MYRIKCDLQIRGNDWGVSLGAGKVVGLNENLGDGQTLASLIENGSITPDYFEDLQPVAAPALPDVEEEL